MVSLRTAARRFAAGLTLTLAAAFLAAGAAQGQQLTDGKEYTRLKVAQAVDTGKKIEVLEFFSYGCPHCAHLDPELAKWQKTLPADVEFKRVPVMFQDRWVALAKVYYTLEAMGEERRLTPEVFIALHEKGSNLWQDKVFFDWAAQHGLDRKKVEDVYGSFAVSSKINRAKQLSQAYNVQSVPMVVVDGKFVTASDRVGTHANLPPVIDQLVAKARAERPKS